MKYSKILGMAAVGAVAMLVLAGPASATSLTSPEGTTYTGAIVGETLGSGLTFHGPLGANYSCTNSTAKGTVQQHGASVTASGVIQEWTLANCNMFVSVKNLGSITIHTESAGSNGNGTVTASGTVVETKSPTGTTCVYTTNETDIGILTGSNVTGGHARLVIKGAIIPRTGGSALCGASGSLTGEWTITTPSTLYVD